MYLIFGESTKNRNKGSKFQIGVLTGEKTEDGELLDIITTYQFSPSCGGKIPELDSVKSKDFHLVWV